MWVCMYRYHLHVCGLVWVGVWCVRMITPVCVQNRGLLKDGSVLKLVKSPEGAALDLLERLAPGKGTRSADELRPMCV